VDEAVVLGSYLDLVGKAFVALAKENVNTTDPARRAVSESDIEFVETRLHDVFSGIQSSAVMSAYGQQVTAIQDNYALGVRKLVPGKLDGLELGAVEVNLSTKKSPIFAFARAARVPNVWPTGKMVLWSNVVIAQLTDVNTGASFIASKDRAFDVSIPYSKNYTAKPWCLLYNSNTSNWTQIEGKKKTTSDNTQFALLCSIEKGNTDVILAVGAHMDTVDKKSGGPNLAGGPIAGIVIACIIACLLLVLLALCILKKQKPEPKKNNKLEEPKEFDNQNAVAAATLVNDGPTEKPTQDPVEGRAGAVGNADGALNLVVATQVANREKGEETKDNASGHSPSMSSSSNWDEASQHFHVYQDWSDIGTGVQHVQEERGAEKNQFAT
jgi:hypothetical protein